MVRFATLVASSSLVFGLCSAIPCGAGSKCPRSAPCCSAYGVCGAGAYCLGGCDPKSSFSLKSCMPRPVCKSATFDMSSLDGFEANTVYLGDASQANWVTEGTPAPYGSEAVLLTMPPSTSGTLLATTHYVWYGKISATLKTSRGAGVVTAFIMMSDVKDEIDFEFVGVDVQHAQSNFYWQGVKNYTNSANLTSANTDTEWHTYELNWTQDSLTWSVDGTVLRTLEKSQTQNPNTGQYNYPQTPSRVQISLWPAGLRKNGEGTIDWAGGLINWNSPYMSNGYYYAQLKEVSIECADVPDGTTQTGSSAYVYKDLQGLQSSVEITDDNTILGSFLATGENPDFHPDKTKPDPQNTESATPTPPTVPGMSGGGVRDPGTGGSDPPAGVPSAGPRPPGYPHGTDNPAAFDQGLDNRAAFGKNEKAVHGSVLGVLIAVGALIAL